VAQQARTSLKIFHCHLPKSGNKLEMTVSETEELHQKLGGILSEVKECIRRCQREGCKKVFLSHKRQIYGSNQCAASKFRVREYRATLN